MAQEGTRDYFAIPKGRVRVCLQCCGSYILGVTCYSYKLHFSASNLLQLQYNLKVSSYFWSYCQQRVEYNTRDVVMNNSDQIM